MIIIQITTKRIKKAGKTRQVDYFKVHTVTVTNLSKRKLNCALKRLTNTKIYNVPQKGNEIDRTHYSSTLRKGRNCEVDVTEGTSHGICHWQPLVPTISIHFNILVYFLPITSPDLLFFLLSFAFLDPS